MVRARLLHMQPCTAPSPIRLHPTFQLAKAQRGNQHSPNAASCSEFNRRKLHRRRISTFPQQENVFSPRQTPPLNANAAPTPPLPISHDPRTAHQPPTKWSSAPSPTANTTSASCAKQSTWPNSRSNPTKRPSAAYSSTTAKSSVAESMEPMPRSTYHTRSLPGLLSLSTDA